MCQMCEEMKRLEVKWDDEEEDRLMNEIMDEVDQNMYQEEKEQSEFMLDELGKALLGMNLPPRKEKDPMDEEMTISVREWVELRERVSEFYKNETRYQLEVRQLEGQVKKEQLERELATNKLVYFQTTIDTLQNRLDNVTEDRRVSNLENERLRSQTTYLNQDRQRLEEWLYQDRREARKMKLQLMKVPGPYYIRLLSWGGNKIQCIKGVREYFDLGLKEAKDLVEMAPVWIACDISWEAVQLLMKAMTNSNPDYVNGEPPLFAIEKLRVN